MTARLTRCIAFFVLTLARALPAAAQGGQDLVPLATEVQNLQTGMALGDAAAPMQQAAALREMATDFENAKPDVLKSRQDLNATIVYLLSGGSPQPILNFLKGRSLPKDDNALILGSLDYVFGRRDEASDRLASIDPRRLAPTIGGQVAFVQSVLVSSRDKEKAIQLLELARLLSPGGLIEEAALRRESALAVQEGDLALVSRLSRQYIGRFANSIYAHAFLRSLAQSLAGSTLVDSLASFAECRGVFLALEPTDRSQTLLAVARASLLKGALPVTAAASQMALQEAAAGGVDQARGQLYQGAARIMMAQYALGVAEIDGVAVEKLNASDAALLIAVRTLARRVRETPQESASESPKPAEASTKEDGASETIKFAEAAVGQARLTAGRATP